MHWQTENLALQARDGIPKLRLQVRPGTPLKQVPLKCLLGTTLPDNPQGNTGPEQATEQSIYWLAPNDWLLLNPPADPDSIKAALQDAAANTTCAVTDVSDAWSIMDLSGKAAPAKLAQGCSVNFDDGAFPTGHYALTRLQHLAVIIHRLDNTPQFRILVDRSLRQFLCDWITALNPFPPGA